MTEQTDRALREAVAKAAEARISELCHGQEPFLALPNDARLTFNPAGCWVEIELFIPNAEIEGRRDFCKIVDRLGRAVARLLTRPEAEMLLARYQSLRLYEGEELHIRQE